MTDHDDQPPENAAAIAEEGMRAFLQEHRSGIPEDHTATTGTTATDPEVAEDQIRSALLTRLACDLDEVRTRPGRLLAAWEAARDRADQGEARILSEGTVVPLPPAPVRALAARPAVVRPSVVRPATAAARVPAAGEDDHRARRRVLVAAGVLLGSAAAVVLAVLVGAALRGLPSDDVYREAPAAATVDPPTGTPQNGVLVEAVVHEDGTQTVTEWVTSDRPLTKLALRAPADPALDTSPKAVDVKVTVRGRQISGDEAVSRPASVYYLYEPADLVKITYTLDDSVLVSPDVDGRALVVASALRVGDAATGPVRVRITGGEVLSMACATRDGSPDPCGEPAGQGWQVILSGDDRDDRVITQLDLG